YFARPVTREQYLLGKLIPPVALVGIVSIGAPLLLAGVRLALADSAAELAGLFWLPAKAIAIGSLEALAFGVSVVAISSLSRSRGSAQGAFAGVFLLPWVVAHQFIPVTRSAWPMLLSVRHHLYNVGRALFGGSVEPGEHFLPVWVSLIALAGWIGGSLWMLRR